MKFISQRCVNEKTYESKLEINIGKHLYLDNVQSVAVEDKVSFEHNMKKLFSEMLKINPSTEILNSLMEQTYVCP